MRLSIASAWTMLAAALLLPADAYTAPHAIDTQRSSITIRVYKSGLFSVFAHNHEITTPVARGEIEDSGNPSVEFWVDAAALRVADSDLSEKDRADVQRTMEGPDVLDISRFSTIHFRSTGIQQIDNRHWVVRGDLDLHGETHSVLVQVAENNGSYAGSATLKQRDYAMQPVRIAGGTVSVKDTVKIEFEIVPVR